MTLPAHWESVMTHPAGWSRENSLSASAGTYEKLFAAFHCVKVSSKLGWMKCQIA